jgi:hypothetical protein
MIKFTFRWWHALAALLAVAVCARAVPLDAAVSAAAEPDQAILLAIASGARCEASPASSGLQRSGVFAVADSALPLVVTAIDADFVSDSVQAWADRRVRVSFRDIPDPSANDLSEHPEGATREAPHGTGRITLRSANAATVRFQQPVTLTGASRYAVSLSLMDEAGGVWMDTLVFGACRQPEAPWGGRAAGITPDVEDVKGILTLKIYGAWLSPPPTLPPIPKPTDTPTPAPPVSIMAYIPVVRR